MAGEVQATDATTESKSVPRTVVVVLSATMVSTCFRGECGAVFLYILFDYLFIHTNFTLYIMLMQRLSR